MSGRDACSAPFTTAGFAGICFPVEYGGLGLTRAHQRAFTQESLGYQMPTLFNVPTLSILAATLLDFGTEAQKQRHIPGILRGDELWVQFLSEPSGGSDLAGLVTTATRDGDVFILNGSKIWSSGAFRSDYALCLARTDPHVRKHQGLTMFIMKIHQPGVEVLPIKMVSGASEFCQEFFDDVAIPVDDVVGEVNDGWTVASRLLFHERDAVGGGSPYVSGAVVGGGERANQRYEYAELARRVGRLGGSGRPSAGRGGPHRRSGVPAAHREGDRRHPHRRSTGDCGSDHPACSPRPTRSVISTPGSSWSAPAAGAWEEDDPIERFGRLYLTRQVNSLGGGSSEMARNIISERVLGMPREYAPDRDRPFDEVRHNVASTRHD